MGVDGGVVLGDASSGVGRVPQRRVNWPALRRALQLRRRLPVLLSVFAVPVLTLLAALWLGSDVDAEWRQVTRTLAAGGFTPPTLAEACRAPAFDELRAFCAHAHHVVVLRQAALGAIGGGLLILGAIRLAAALGRRDRRLLLLFLPGLYLTTLSVLVLIPVHAFLVMGAFYVLVEATGAGYSMLPVAGVGALAIIAMIATVPELFGFLRVPRLNLTGVTVTRRDDPGFWDFLDKIALRIGTRPPDTVVVGFRPNFFVTEARVAALDARCAGRTLYLSLPLCRILSRDELSAVVAHELAHFSGDDTRLSRSFAPVYHGASSTRAHIQSLSRTGFGLALLPAISILGYFLDAFALAERTVSRQRELTADQHAARVTSALALGTALVKLHAFGESWQAVRWAYAHGKAAPNASQAYAEIVQGRSRSEILAGVASRRQPHPFDSHPTLELRLRALGLTPGGLEVPALETNPSEAAISLLREHEPVERALTEVLRQELQDHHG